jgi:Gene product 88
VGFPLSKLDSISTTPNNKVGIVVNNIPHLKKKQGVATFASLQQERDERIKELKSI